MLNFCPLKTEEIDKNQTLEFKKNVKKSRVEVDRNSETLEPNCFLRKFWKLLAYNVPALGEVAKFGTDYFLSKIKFLARNKREFTTKFAILPNAC